jgi:hypothetical protein
MGDFGKEYKEIASKVLDCTLASYYNWSKQDRPIIDLLEKCFTKEDLENFIDSRKLPYKIEATKNLTDEELEKKLNSSHNQDILSNVEKMLSELKGVEATKKEKVESGKKASEEKSNDNIKQREVVSKILGNSSKSYYRWKEENRPIMSFLENNFSKEELNEYLETGKIQELEEFKEFKQTKQSDEYQEFLEFKQFQEFKNGTHSKTSTNEEVNTLTNALNDVADAVDYDGDDIQELIKKLQNKMNIANAVIDAGKTEMSKIMDNYKTNTQESQDTDKKTTKLKRQRNR